MTAARVMTSHLPTVSSGSSSGGLAVCMISDQAASRVRRVIGWAGVSWAAGAVVMGRRLAPESQYVQILSLARGAGSARGLRRFLNRLHALTTSNSGAN